MTTELTGEILKRLDKLAEFTLQQGQHFWPVLLKQVQLEGGIALGLGGVLIGVGSWGVYRAITTLSDNDGYCVLSTVSFFCSACLTSIGLVRFFNPEYYALQELLLLVR